MILSVSPRRESCFESDEDTRVVFTIFPFILKGASWGLHVSVPWIFATWILPTPPPPPRKPQETQGAQESVLPKTTLKP